MREKTYIIQRVDKPILFMYLSLLIMGLLTVFAVSYHPEETQFFNLSQTHGRQMTWMFISLLMGFSLLTFNSNFFTKLSIPFYIIMVLLLLITVVVAREINGARSWLQIGPAQFQPAEFAKTATALMLAKYISSLNNAHKTLRQKIIAGGIIAIPMGIIVLQEDVGSALVYTSLTLVLFREGFQIQEVFVSLFFGLGFILSLLVPVAVIYWLLTALFIVYTLLVSGKFWRKERPKALLFYVAGTVFLALFTLGFYQPESRLYFVGAAFLLIPVLWLIIRASRNISFIPILLLYTAITVFSVYGSDFVMNDVLEPHQSQRVLTLFGLSDDPDANYNVVQSKMTIGSGGFSGKGYLEGTLTQLKHVPEQSTDFIFCTIGEELGFLGTSLFLILYLSFILRILYIAERQRSPFTRIYCYAVAAIFFIQVMINVGMTIGLVPVIGIPLPFISYGGSSVLAFSIMVFLVLRLDADRLLILR